MTFGKIACLVAAISLTSMVVPAFAQGPDDCTCLTPYNIQAQKVGSVVSANGSVMVGFADAAKGSPLAVGSRIDVGSKSTANISVGTSCNVALRANATAVVDKVGQQLCVRLTETRSTAAKTYGAPLVDFSQFNFPVIFFGTVAIGTAIALATAEDGTPLPPGAIKLPIIGTPVSRQ